MRSRLTSPRSVTSLRFFLGCLAAPLLTVEVPRLFAQSEPTQAESAPGVASLRPKQGTLRNGLRYVILASPGMPGGIGVRLVVQAGSLNENDDEQGYAHFIEHLAFSGTRHFGPGELVRFFQNAGVAYGPDLGAETSFSYTVYRVDLPESGRENLHETLRVFRDFAGGIRFEASDINRERAIILSEAKARDNAGLRVARDSITALYTGTKIPARFPIGTEAVLSRATVATLRSTYERLYRPERMTLIVAGDVDATLVETAITETLESLLPGKSETPPPPWELPRTGFGIHTINNPVFTSAAVSLISILPSVRSRAWETIFPRLVAIRLLDRRLAEQRELAAGIYGAAGARSVSAIDGHFTQVEMEAQTAAADWKKAVSLLERELRRARERGFTAAEVNETIAGTVATIRELTAAQKRATGPGHANQLVQQAITGDDWIDWSESGPAAERGVRALTPESVQAALAALFPPDKFQIQVRSRSPVAGGIAAIQSAWIESARQPLPDEKVVVESELHFRYLDFGPPGTIDSRSTDADLDLERVHFANGVMLNLRKSNFEPGHFRLRARIGRGFADVPRDQPGLALLALTLLTECPLGRHTREEIGRILKLKGAGASMDFSNDRVGFEISGPATELPFAFQFLTALLSDSRISEDKLKTGNYGAYHAALFSTAARRAEAGALFRSSNRDPRFRFPSGAEMDKVNFATVNQYLNSLLQRASLEIGVVGDIDSEAALQAALGSVGTLPPRDSGALQPAEKLHFAAPPQRVISREPMPDKTAAVCFYWAAPEAGAAPAARALQVATEILLNRIRDELREKQGATYSPTAGVSIDPLQRDFAYASLTLTLPPEQAEKLAKRVVEIAANLATKGVTSEEFERARNPLRAGAAENFKKNTWWLQQVAIWAQSQPQVLDEARSLQTGFSTLTLTDVNHAARCFAPANAGYYGVRPTKVPAQK